MAMRMLLPSEYDESYFDGRRQDLRHNAGYGEYKDSIFDQLAEQIVADYPEIFNKKMIDVGCAYGFLVKHLRDKGVNCIGRDLSAYALARADPKIRKFLKKKDASDSYPDIDGIISTRLLICFDEDTVDKIIPHFNESAEFQIHLIDNTPNEKYYLRKPLEWWISKPWNKGTILISYENWSKYLIK